MHWCCYLCSPKNGSWQFPPAIHREQINPMHEKVSTNWSTILSKKLAISSRKAIKKAVIFSQILETFISSEVHTWRGAGNKKSSRHRTKGTEVEDHGWVSVAVYFLYFRREVWIFFFRGERRAQVIWLTMGTATAGVFGPKAHS